MKRVARPHEHQAITGIPHIIGIRVVRVEPPIGIAVHVEDVEIAIRVGNVCDAI